MSICDDWLRQRSVCRGLDAFREHRLERIVSEKANYRIKLTFNNGKKGVVYFSEYLLKGGVFDRFKGTLKNCREDNFQDPGVRSLPLKQEERSAMPALKAGYIVQAVEDAFAESVASAVLVSRIREHPRRFYVTAGEASFPVWVYIWTLTHGGGTARPADEYRIRKFFVLQ